MGAATPIIEVAAPAPAPVLTPANILPQSCLKAAAGAPFALPPLSSVKIPRISIFGRAWFRNLVKNLLK